MVSGQYLVVSGQLSVVSRQKLVVSDQTPRWFCTSFHYIELMLMDIVFRRDAIHCVL